MKKKVVLIGDSLIAEIAYEYFTHDSEYEVVAFSVNRAYLKKDSFCGLPVVAFEELASLYPPATHDVFVAIGYNRLNQVRIKFYNEVKALGYKCANYVSSKAFVWHNVKIGENVFIFEDNTIQPFVTIGNNNILWSGNHIGHHSTIGDHNFISSHVVISGNCIVGHGCFMGVNSACANDLTIADDCVFAMGAMITKNTTKGGFYTGSPAQAHPRLTAYSAMKTQEDVQ